VLEASRAREEREAGLRERYAAGELGLDVNAMRERLQRNGLTYIGHDAWLREQQA
jgi:4-hydroxy-4-methyl-2-oxoglutarate aldolase